MPFAKRTLAFIFFGILTWGVVAPVQAAGNIRNTGINSPLTARRFGYIPPKSNILPGTQKKRACIAHGQARCIKRPQVANPFISRYRSSDQEVNYRNPLMKRNQPLSN